MQEVKEEEEEEDEMEEAGRLRPVVGWLKLLFRI